MLEPERNTAFRDAARAAAGELHWDREAQRLADEYRQAADRRGRSAGEAEERPVS
jgi:hypothetical protein